jgi:hypothetical protein
MTVLVGALGNHGGCSHACVERVRCVLVSLDLEFEVVHVTDGLESNSRRFTVIPRWSVAVCPHCRTPEATASRHGSGRCSIFWQVAALERKEVRTPSEVWYVARELYQAGKVVDAKEMFERVVAAYPPSTMTTRRNTAAHRLILLGGFSGVATTWHTPGRRRRHWRWPSKGVFRCCHLRYRHARNGRRATPRTHAAGRSRHPSHHAH